MFTVILSLITVLAIGLWKIGQGVKKKDRKLHLGLADRKFMPKNAIGKSLTAI